MPPHIETNESKLNDCEIKKEKEIVTKEWNCLNHIIWINVLWFATLHTGSIYALYLCFDESKILTHIFAILLYNISIFGITAGSHRLWTHRSYKARLPFRAILAICNSIAYQGTIYEWVRDHRVHHKYPDTNADPSNSRRGFFFSHIGSLMCRKHPDIKRKGGKIDLSDILADPVVAFQKKFYVLSVVIFCFTLPTVIPWYFWNETMWNAFFIAVILRYTLERHATFLVNSAAHMWGYRPYDGNIAPVENASVSFLTLGEGWHNYHHTFPWDYSTSEWGWNINLTTFVLDQLAKIGWVYDRRYATKDLIEKRKLRTGLHGVEYAPHEHEY